MEEEEEEKKAGLRIPLEDFVALGLSLSEREKNTTFYF